MIGSASIEGRGRRGLPRLYSVIMLESHRNSFLE